MVTKEIESNCDKYIEIYPGVIQYQNCSCEKCEKSKKASKEFFIRFDALYSQFQKEGAPEN